MLILCVLGLLSAIVKHANEKKILFSFTCQLPSVGSCVCVHEHKCLEVLLCVWQELCLVRLDLSFLWFPSPSRLLFWRRPNALYCKTKAWATFQLVSCSEQMKGAKVRWIKCVHLWHFSSVLSAGGWISVSVVVGPRPGTGCDPVREVETSCWTETKDATGEDQHGCESNWLTWTNED